MTLQTVMLFVLLLSGGLVFLDAHTLMLGGGGSSWQSLTLKYSTVCLQSLGLAEAVLSVDRFALWSGLQPKEKYKTLSDKCNRLKMLTSGSDSSWMEVRTWSHLNRSQTFSVSLQSSPKPGPANLLTSRNKHEHMLSYRESQRPRLESWSFL